MNEKPQPRFCIMCSHNERLHFALTMGCSKCWCTQTFTTTNFMNNTLRMVLLLACVLLISALSAKAQQTCPENLVCISKEAARAALEAGDKAKALEAENKAQAKAIDDLKQLLNDMKVNYATAAAEASILKQQQVRDSAMLEIMLKLVRPKRVGINIF